MAWSIGALAILSVGLLVLAAARWRRRTETRRSAPEAPAVPERDTFRPRASRPNADTDSAPRKTCPVCHSAYPAQNRFCVQDGAALLEGGVSGPFAQGMICPTCRRGYPSDASFCPEDADELVPYGLFGAASCTKRPLKLDSNKICPECGVRHAAVHLFCGQDGAELVVVN